MAERERNETKRDLGPTLILANRRLDKQRRNIFFLFLVFGFFLSLPSSCASRVTDGHFPTPTSSLFSSTPPHILWVLQPWNFFRLFCFSRLVTCCSRTGDWLRQPSFLHLSLLFLYFLKQKEKKGFLIFKSAILILLFFVLSFPMERPTTTTQQDSQQE